LTAVLRSIGRKFKKWKEEEDID